MDTPPPPVRNPGAMSRKQLKGKIQAGVQERVNDFWKENIGHYIMQGDYLALLMEEDSCITWKSYLWDIPQGVLKFAINAGINTLPTLDNLRRWGKRVNDRCPFCGNIQTLLHVLSNCSTSLDQGRYTWRHDSVLLHIVEMARSNLKEGYSVFSDLIGFRAPHGGVVPPHILVTTLKPDIFIVNEITREIVIVELTCPWDANIERSHNYKQEKYSALVADLSRHFRVKYYPVEVSVRGQVSKNNKSRFKSFLYDCCGDPRRLSKLIVIDSSKIAMLCSFSIFSARKEPAWSSPSPLRVR